MKYLANIEGAEAILYHHFRYDTLYEVDSEIREAALLLHLADRIDLLCNFFRDDGAIYNYLLGQKGTLFAPDLVDSFIDVFENNKLLDMVRNNRCGEVMRSYFQAIEYDNADAERYLRALALTVDFRSGYTADSSILTQSIATKIAELLGLDKEVCQEIYFGALLCDLGRINTPIKVLDKTEKLSDEELLRIKYHAVITKNILDGKLREGITRIAYRHHEKLDGSGYAEGINGDELTESERLVAISDIVSALMSERSFKPKYDKGQIVEILLKEAADGKLDKSICEVFIANYDAVMTEAKEKSKEVLQIYGAFKGEYTRLDLKPSLISNSIKL